MPKAFTMLLEPVIMKLDSSWFVHGYYVYVVIIKHQSNVYYYVGMTGDRKHVMARSPFYRMNGHFMLKERSTQNQIIKGLSKKFTGLSREELAFLLREMDFTIPGLSSRTKQV